MHRSRPDRCLRINICSFTRRAKQAKNPGMSKSYTTQAIAEALYGQLIGKGDILIERVTHPADVQGAGDLALAMDKKLVPLLVGSSWRALPLSAMMHKMDARPDRCLHHRQPPAT